MATDRISGSQQASVMAAALAELERMVAAQAEHPAESVLAAYPHLAKDPEATLELIYTEHVLRQEAGEHLAFDLWAKRFPQWTDELRKLFDVHELIGDPRPQSSRSTGPSAIHDTWRSRPEEEHDLPSWRIRDYELLERIGAGGMGTVYRARQQSLDRIVAVKTVAASSVSNAVTLRFEAEARSAARLQHPNIVQVFEVGTSDGVPYFSMEYVHGGNLSDLTKERPLEPRHAAILLERLAQAIHYAHGQMVIHRDLKPANILIQPADATSEERRRDSLADLPGKSLELGYAPKIADFGLARLLDAATTLSLDDTAIGTPSYMAPEQAAGDHRTDGVACDIYGLGAILYDVLVGRPPFAAPSVIETLQQVREDDPVRPREMQPRIPVDLETICLCCLRKDPAERYATAQALADDLRRFLQGQPIRARTARLGERLTKWVRRYPLVSALLGAIFLAALGMGAQWVRAEQSRVAERASHEHSKRLVYAQEIQLAQRDFAAGQMSQAANRLARTSPEFRNWEYNYLTQQSRDVERSFRTSPAFAGAVDLSPDGSLVACGSRNDWGVDTPGQLSVWNVHTGELVHALNGHPGGVLAVNFSPCGRYLASGGVYWGPPPTAGGLQVWDLSTGKPKFAVPGIEAYSTRFSPDGASLAVGLANGPIHLYSVASGEKVREFLGHRDFVRDVAFRPDGKYLASAGRDGTLRAWSLDPAIPHPQVYAFQATRDIRNVDWSSNARDLLACSFSGSIRFLKQREDGTIIETGRLDQDLPVTDIRYSPDGQYIVVAGRSAPVTILDATTRRSVARIQAHDAWGMSLAFDASGRILASGGADGTIQVRDLSDVFLANHQFTRLGADVQAVAVHPDRPQAALALGRNPRRPVSISGVPRVQIVDLETDAILRELSGCSDWLTCVAYAPDGRHVVAGSHDGTVCVWDAEQGRRQHSLKAHDGSVTGVAFVLDGSHMLSSGQDHLLKMFSVETGAVVHQWSTGDQEVVSLAVSSNLIAAAMSDRQIRFFNAHKREAWTSCRHGRSALIAATFRPAGDVLALAKSDGSIDLWSVPQQRDATASRIQTLKGHTAQIDSIAFSPDGERLASGGRDRSIKWWDWRVGRELLAFKPRDGVGHNLLGISPDGRILKVWDQNQFLTWAVQPAPTADRPAVPDKGLALRALDPVGEANRGTAGWHRNQLERAQKSGNYHSQRFHLSRLIELEPKEQVDHRFARSQVQMVLGQWSEADQDLRSVLEHKDTVDLRVALARTALQLGNMDEYQRHCKRLGEITRQSRSLEAWNDWAWVAALSPQSQTDFEAVRSDLESKLSRKSQAAVHTTAALVSFRAGQLDAARQHVETSLKLSPTVNVPFDWVVLALIHAGQGDAQLAKHYLDQVQTWIYRQGELRSIGLETARAYDVYREPDLTLLVGEIRSLLDRLNGSEKTSP
jgi:eukaryotic-like serine/threonine-protein kinase